MDNRLTVFEHESVNVVDSREVAGMIGKPHNDLMKAIRGYCEHLTAGNFSLSEFFIQSTYEDSTGRTLPCYLLTKKGCDMVANKMTGQKGVLFTAAYVTAFEEMKERILHGKVLPDSMRLALAEARLKNSRVRASSVWLKIASTVDIPEYKQICASYASKELAGHEVIPLPAVKERYYTATEIGDMFGLSKSKVGQIANSNGLKTDEFGRMVWDKSPFSPKQVQTFQYI